MEGKIQKFLPLAAVILVIAMVVGSIGITLFLSSEWFFVVGLLAVALAAYRPQWVFWLFIAMVPLETAIVGSVAGMDIRAYQLLVVAAAVGAMVRWKKYCTSFRFAMADWIMVGLVAASGVSAIAATDVALSMRQTIIFASFAFIYFLVRVFVRSWEDVKKLVPYVFGPYFVVAFYAIWQNWRFSRGLESFEVMTGRPNAVFPEADWLGMYLAAGAVALSVYLFLYIRGKKDKKDEKKLPRKVRGERMLAHEILLFGFIAIVLTVARSSWLAALAGLGVSKIFLWRRFGFFAAFSWGKRVAVLLLSSIAVVYIFGLTTFELWNRVQSTGSGLQEITVACDTYELADLIPPDADLAQYGCKHINLEDISRYEADGYFIHKIYRNDPNVNVRQIVWTRSLEEIRAHPLLGIGWGSIGEKLGTDERGAVLSASNIFLEFWLGAGIIGVIGIAALFVRVAVGAAQMIRAGEHALTGIALLGGLTAIVIGNLFNSGQFLAFLWVYLGLAVTITEVTQKNAEVEGK